MQDRSERSDAELYAKLQSSRRQASAAFSELYDRYANRVYSYARHILNDDDLAGDVLQESFVKLFELAAKHEEVRNIPALLLRIARNLSLNEIKKRKRPVVALNVISIAVEDRSLEQAEFKALIEAAIDTLPEENREALLLKEYGGMSYREIAELNGISLTAVRSRIFRARMLLRDVLAPYLQD